MAFPTSVTSFPATSGTEVLGVMGSGVGLSGMLNNLATDVIALENKVGTGATTPAANQILFGTGSGTSAWQGLTSAQLAAVLSDETGSGAAVFANSPTIVTPTIASFANANHDHSNSAGGGQITSTGLAAGAVKQAALDTSAGGIGAAMQSWTPTWTNLTIGNGVNASKYVQIGKVVFARLSFTFGTTSSLGSGAFFTLPVTSVTLGAEESLGALSYYDSSATAGYLLNVGWKATSSAYIRVPSASGGVTLNQGTSATVPVAYGTSDAINGYFMYEAA